MRMFKTYDSNTIKFSYIDSGHTNDAHMNHLIRKWMSEDHLTHE